LANCNVNGFYIDVASGISMDWAYRNLTNLKLAITYELRDKGRYGQLLPPEQILPSCEEFMEGFIVMLNELLPTPIPGP